MIIKFIQDGDGWIRSNESSGIEHACSAGKKISDIISVIEYWLNVETTEPVIFLIKFLNKDIIKFCKGKKKASYNLTSKIYYRINESNLKICI